MSHDTDTRQQTTSEAFEQVDTAFVELKDAFKAMFVELRAALDKEDGQETTE